MGVTLKRQRMETLRPLAVTLCAAGGQPEGGAGCMPLAERGASPSCPAHMSAGAKKGTPSAASLLLAGWVLVCTTLAPAVRTAQTIMALYRCRWHVDIAIKRWKSVLDVDA